MKYYVFIRPNDCTDTDEVYHAGNWKKISDFHYELDNCYTYRRPVEIRDPGELSNQDIYRVANCFHHNDENRFPLLREDIILISHKLDELRSRPRETEKEKWIRKRTIGIVDTDINMSEAIAALPDILERDIKFYDTLIMIVCREIKNNEYGYQIAREIFDAYDFKPDEKATGKTWEEIKELIIRSKPKEVEIGFNQWWESAGQFTIQKLWKHDAHLIWDAIHEAGEREG